MPLSRTRSRQQMPQLECAWMEPKTDIVEMRVGSLRLSLQDCSKRPAIHPTDMMEVMQATCHSVLSVEGSRCSRLRCFPACPGSSMRTRWWWWWVSILPGCHGGMGRQHCRGPSGAVCHIHRILSPYRGMPCMPGGSRRIFVSFAYTLRNRLATAGIEACCDGVE